MEQDRTREYPAPEVFKCCSWSAVMLQTTYYTQHEDECGNTQQYIKKVLKLKIGSECKYNQKNNTEYGTKQDMQSRHRMPETNQCRRLYMLARISTSGYTLLLEN